MNNAHTPAIGLLMLLASLVSSSVSADILHVDDDAPPGGDGLTWTTAYDDLQDALNDASTNGAVTEIRVAGGTYTPSQRTESELPRTETFSLISGVTISGGYAGLADPENPDVRDLALYESTLSGDLNGDDAGDLWDPSREENTYHVVTGSGTDETAVLDGFRITGGNADGSFPNGIGGGMTSRGSPTMTNCIFSRNYAHNGGGMYILDGSPMLRGCTFSHNSALAGGGLTNVDSLAPRLTDCAFVSNSAHWGGGMHSDESSPILVGCVFRNNIAEDAAGGISCSYGRVTMTNCTLIGNSATSGGGVYLGWASDSTLTNCTFIGNSATAGSGVYSYSSSTPTIANCTFAANMASNGCALGRDSEQQQEPTTIEMTNCILWNGGDEIWNNDGSTITVTYSDVQGGWPGTGNIDDDPLFVDYGYGEYDDTPGDANDDARPDGDYRLQPGSPCVDTADPAFVPEPGATDLDGHARVLCSIVDMGAYEFGIGDYDCDRSVDLADYESWSECFTGPFAGAYEQGCRAFDFDFDGDVDLLDFAGFQGVFEGD